MTKYIHTNFATNVTISGTHHDDTYQMLTVPNIDGI